VNGICSCSVLEVEREKASWWRGKGFEVEGTEVGKKRNPRAQPGMAVPQEKLKRLA
jgi:hypothetical protein